MFSNELKRASTRWGNRARGMVLGTLILITVAAALVSARTVPFLYCLTFLSFLAAALLAGRARALVSDEECAAHDQRGVARSPNPSESCDAGAVESFDGRVSTPLFLDGFQSGTAGVWSDAAP